jgi:hypothetical protein
MFRGWKGWGSGIRITENCHTGNCIAINCTGGDGGTASVSKLQEKISSEAALCPGCAHPLEPDWVEAHENALRRKSEREWAILLRFCAVIILGVFAVVIVRGLVGGQRLADTQPAAFDPAREKRSNCLFGDAATCRELCAEDKAHSCEPPKQIVGQRVTGVINPPAGTRLVPGVSRICDTLDDAVLTSKVDSRMAPRECAFIDARAKIVIIYNINGWAFVAYQDGVPDSRPKTWFKGWLPANKIIQGDE